MRVILIYCSRFMCISTALNELMKGKVEVSNNYLSTLFIVVE